MDRSAFDGTSQKGFLVCETVNERHKRFSILQHVQNLEEKERKLHQTRSNFRTGNSDLDGKHLPER